MLLLRNTNLRVRLHAVAHGSSLSQKRAIGTICYIKGFIDFSHKFGGNNLFSLNGTAPIHGAR